MKSKMYTKEAIETRNKRHELRSQSLGKNHSIEERLYFKKLDAALEKNPDMCVWEFFRKHYKV